MPAFLVQPNLVRFVFHQCEDSVAGQAVADCEILPLLSSEAKQLVERCAPDGPVGIDDEVANLTRVARFAGGFGLHSSFALLHQLAIHETEDNAAIGSGGKD